MVTKFLNIWNDLLLFLGINKPAVPLPEIGHELFYDSREDFPPVGKINNWYMDSKTATLYTWDGKSYIQTHDVVMEDKTPTGQLSLPLGGFKPGELIIFGGIRPGALRKTNFAASEMQKHIENTTKEIPKL